MSSLDRLLNVCPGWVTYISRSRGSVRLTARPPLARQVSGGGFQLELHLTDKGGVLVKECAGAAQLPGFCPERHINPDGSFCIFYGSEAAIEDEAQASSWWEGLSVFLVNQGYAERRGVWPLESGLSHSDAAGHQVAMEALAEPLGWKDDILTSMFRASGWLSGRLPRISKEGSRVLNVRTSCPRGCTWKHRQLRKRSCETEACFDDCRKLHKPILRKDCPNRRTVEKLILHEHQRRKIETEFVSELKKKMYRCCGTMKTCPLAASVRD